MPHATLPASPPPTATNFPFSFFIVVPSTTTPSIIVDAETGSIAYVVIPPVTARFPSSISAPSSSFLSLIPAIVTQSDTASEGAVIAPDALIAAVFSTEENVFSPVIVCLVPNVTKVLSTYFLSAFVSSISARLSVSAIPDKNASSSFHLFMIVSVSEPSKKSFSLLDTADSSDLVA